MLRYSNFKLAAEDAVKHKAWLYLFDNDTFAWDEKPVDLHNVVWQMNLGTVHIDICGETFVLIARMLNIKIDAYAMLGSYGYRSDEAQQHVIDGPIVMAGYRDQSD